MKTILEITNTIYVIRDQKVMFDFDLAEIYGVEVRVLNQAVSRNKERFPDDFCFSLNFSELAAIKSQSVIRSLPTMRKGMTPNVFTEQGAFALSFILNSEKAIEMGVFIARAFTHLRRFILKNENLMMELKNNEHLTQTFRNFEKRIEQDLIVLYKNNSQKDKRLSAIEDEVRRIKEKLGLDKP